MNIDVLLLPVSLEEIAVQGKTLVVVDVLRASSTMIVAMARGASRIDIVETVEDARKMALMHPESVLIGEEASIKPDDFYYDNSPLELYLSSELKGKSLIMRSSNGTRLLKKIQLLSPANTYIGSFLNLEALADYLKAEKTEDVLICCAGNGSEISLEDTGFAGALIECIKAFDVPVSLTDSGQLALHLWSGINRDIDRLWKESSHAAVLRRLGREQDLTFISETTFSEIPVFSSVTGSVNTGIKHNILRGVTA